jgi:hypothetical protein
MEASGLVRIAMLMVISSSSYGVTSGHAVSLIMSFR